MAYTVKHSRQGLLSVYQGDKKTEWKISNDGGKWTLYCVLPHGAVREHPFDFAPLIHDNEKLADKLNEVIF
tara:strand:- start:69 stop:281 length:213 start_codon:yes stop_codon:yes gene_type:complete